VPCGGGVVGSKRIINGTVLREEAVWFDARLIASNVTQALVAMFFAGLFLTKLFKTTQKLGLFPLSKQYSPLFTDRDGTAPSSLPTPFPLTPL
jgi:hypothetical protein